MTFIITLISLVIERFFHWSHLRHWRWFTTYQQWLSHSRLNRLPSIILFILSILPLALLVGLINCFLNGWFYGILKIIFGIAVLLYCLGPVNLWVQVYRCINQLNKDEDFKAAALNVQTEFGFGPLDSSEAFHQGFTRAIFVAAFSRVFSVVFWFVLLGPVGAILYRSIALMGVESPLGLTHSARKIQRVLDWLPIRIFTFLFALGGHYAPVFSRWKKTVLKGPETNEAMLAECGFAALDVTDEGGVEKSAIDLLDRVFVIMLVILAVMVLIL